MVEQIMSDAIKELRACISSGVLIHGYCFFSSGLYEDDLGEDMARDLATEIEVTLNGILREANLIGEYAVVNKWGQVYIERRVIK